MHKHLHLGLIFGVLCSVALATPKYLSVGEIKPVPLKAGHSAQAVISITVEPPFHVQANPAAHPTLKATTLKVKGGKGVTPGKPVYPPGQPYKLKGAPRALSTYAGKFEIRLPLRAAKTAKPGRHVLKGSLFYQACNENICLFPDSHPLEIPVELSR